MFRKNMEYPDNGNDIARPDPFTQVRTTAAKTETTNTSTHTATIINEDSRTISYQSTRQTVTHLQQARVTEINTVQYSPDKEEMEKFFADLNMNNMDDFSSSQMQQMIDSSILTQRTATTGRFPSFKTETTTVTQTKGSKLTSMVEEHRIQLNNANSTSNQSESVFEVDIDAPNRNTNKRNEFTFPYPQRAITSNIDAQPFSQQNKNSFSTQKPSQPMARKFTTPSLRSTSSMPSMPSDPSMASTPAVPPSPPFSTSTFHLNSPKISENTTTKSSPANEVDESLKTPLFSTLQRRFGAVPKTVASPAQRKSYLKPGFAYIFNNENFDDDRNGSRVGTDADASALFETFKIFNLTIEVYKDACLSKIKSVVKTITSKDFRRHSCLVIAILTHGSRNETVHARDKPYSIDDDILFPIMKNPSLSEKPKILFIQACKGSMEVEDFHKDKPLLSGIPAEILKCYSTFEGYVSYRTEQGTFFIQKLCEELKKHGKTESIEVIMKSVTASVKQLTNGKQIPTMTVNLTEPFIFGDYI